MPTERLSAVDVLNWDYLMQINEFIEPNEIETSSDALRAFSYSFVSTASNEERDFMLTAIIKNATDWNSAESNEVYLNWLSRALKSDLKLLRGFAKQIGVKLGRG